MATISILVKQATPTGDTPLKNGQNSAILITPPRGKAAGGYLRTGDSFPVVLSDGAGSMVLEPSAPGQAYQANELWAGGQNFYFVITGNSSVNYVDLERVDPKTLTEEPPEPAWAVAVQALRDLVEDAGLGNITTDLISDATPLGRELLTAATAATVRQLIGAGVPVSTATIAAAGIVELATPAEAEGGTDSTRAVTAAGVLAAINARIAALLGAASGLASLGPDGKLLTAQLPALAIVETFPVANQAAMLALTAQRGDIAIRTDVSKNFILTVDDPTVVGNWVELAAAPVGGVSSVAGRIGAVVLAAADLSDSGATGRALVKAATAAAARSAIAAIGTVAGHEVATISRWATQPAPADLTAAGVPANSVILVPAAS